MRDERITRELEYVRSRLEQVGRLLAKIRRELTKSAGCDKMTAPRADDQMFGQHETESWPETGLEEAYQLSLEEL